MVRAGRGPPTGERPWLKGARNAPGGTTAPSPRETLGSRWPALVKFLGAQFSESDGVEQKLFAGCFGIFGHGNVAGSTRRSCRPSSRPDALPVHPRTQRAGHGAHRRRVRADEGPEADVRDLSSVGPGATNMVTGAALATINRLPVLLLPSPDTFADRSIAALQEAHGRTTPVTSPSATRSARCRSTSTGSGSPSSCRPRCSVRASAHRPRRDRGRHRLLPPGRRAPGVRLAGRTVRQAGLAHRPTIAGGVRAGPGRRSDQGRRATADRHRRRGALLGSDRGAARACVSRPGSRSASPRRARARWPSITSTVPRGHRLDRDHRRERRSARRGRGDRDRHPVLRLHHGQPDGFPDARRAIRQRQRRSVGWDQACRAQRGR